MPTRTRKMKRPTSRIVNLRMENSLLKWPTKMIANAAGRVVDADAVVVADPRGKKQEVNRVRIGRRADHVASAMAIVRGRSGLHVPRARRAQIAQSVTTNSTT